MTASHRSFAQLPAIRARAIFPIYAKTMAALVKEAFRHTPMKIHKQSFCARPECLEDGQSGAGDKAVPLPQEPRSVEPSA